MTSECIGAPDFRDTIDPTENSGLRVRCQVMADKPVTVRRERIGRHVGHLDDKDILRLNIALAFVMGLADLQPRLINRPISRERARVALTGVG
jgi:mRNA interferase MazF